VEEKEQEKHGTESRAGLLYAQREKQTREIIKSAKVVIPRKKKKCASRKRL